MDPSLFLGQYPVKGPCSASSESLFFTVGPGPGMCEFSERGHPPLVAIFPYLIFFSCHPALSSHLLSSLLSEPEWLIFMFFWESINFQ